MKKNILTIVILFLFANTVYGQVINPCIGNVQIIQTSDCCAKVTFQASTNCNTPFTQITISEASITNTLNIISASSEIGVGFSLDITNQELIFTATGTGFPADGQTHLIGEFCTEQVGISLISAVLIEAGGDQYPPENKEIYFNCPEPIPFLNLYGDSLNNKPMKIMAIGNSVYVIGNRIFNGLSHGTFGRYNMTDGTRICEIITDSNIVFSDFDYNEEDHKFIIVGSKGDPDLDYSDSYFMVINAYCTVVKEQFFPNPNRDSFTKVLVHDNPEDTDAPIYILGRRNEYSPAQDMVMLYNLNSLYTVNWKTRYQETLVNTELEAFRGLEELSNGDLLILGNGSIANEGLVMKVDGLNGDFLSGRYLPGVIDLYTGLELSPGGNILVAGEDWGNHQGVMMILDNNLSTLYGVKEPGVIRYEDIWQDASGNFYSIAQEKTTGVKKNIVQKFSVNSTANTINLDYSKYLINGESDFDKGSIYVNEDFDFLFYTDARLNHPNQFGDWDMMIGFTDLNFSSDCVSDILHVLNTFTLGTTIFNCSNSNPIISPIDFYSDLVLTYGKTTMCVPPGICSFDVEAECDSLTLKGFSNTGDTTGVFSWDIDCDGVFNYSGQTLTIANPNYPSFIPFCINMEVHDTNGAICTFQDSIVNPDVTPPLYNCPVDITVVIPICDTVAFVNIPNLYPTDNCDVLWDSVSHNSGYFHCGSTVITHRASDFSGNISTCSYNVNVVCEALSIDSVSILCSSTVPGAFDVYFEMLNLTGNPTANFSYSSDVFIPLGPNNPFPGTPSTVHSSSQVISGQKIIVNKTVSFTGCHNKFQVLGEIYGFCPTGIEVDKTVFSSLIDIPCCNALSISADSSYCEDDLNIGAGLSYLTPLCGVSRVEWYVADGLNNFGTRPIQSTSSYQPLSILSSYYNTDIYIYAKVHNSGINDPCKGIMISDTVKIRRCEKIPSQNHLSEICNDGTLINNSITLTGLPSLMSCNYSIQWQDFDGTIDPVNNNSLSFTPLPISINDSNLCYKTFTAKAIINNNCGITEFVYRYKLFNENGPDGILTVQDPVICPGDDDVIHYAPACIEPNNTWNWEKSSDGINFTPIPTAGTQNPMYNTNKLYETTWYRVIKNNGICSPDTISTRVHVLSGNDALSFMAKAVPACNPTQVDLSITFPNSAILNYQINWYKGYTLIGTSNSSSSTINFTYSPSQLNEIPGNYSVEYLEPLSCFWKKMNVVTIDEPTSVKIVGPCFRCKEEFVVLEAIISNPYGVCVGEWWDEAGVVTSAGNSTTLNVQPQQTGPFSFLGNCVKDGVWCPFYASYTLMQCGVNTFDVDEDLLNNQSINVFPNPTRDNLKINFANEELITKFTLTDLNGRLIAEENVNNSISDYELNLQENEPGVYILTIYSSKLAKRTFKIIKQ